MTPLKVWADEASELQDLIDLTFQELNETFAETQDLEDIAADAEPYGEEPYQGFEDGTWLTGNEIVDISENGIEERLEQIENLMEQLEDLLEQQYEENGPTYT